MTLHGYAAFLTMVAALRARWARLDVRGARGACNAESVVLHGSGPERYHVPELTSILFWGGVLPVGSTLLSSFIARWSLLGLALYGALWLRVYRCRNLRDSAADAALYASACTVGKFAELQGVVHFAWNCFVRRRTSAPIEYEKI